MLLFFILCDSIIGVLIVYFNTLSKEINNCFITGLITGIASAITAAIFLGGLVYYFYCRGESRPCFTIVLSCSFSLYCIMQNQFSSKSANMFVNVLRLYQFHSVMVIIVKTLDSVHPYCQYVVCSNRRPFFRYFFLTLITILSTFISPSCCWCLHSTPVDWYLNSSIILFHIYIFH